MTSEAEVLWILLAFRLRPRAAAVRLAAAESGPSARTRRKPGSCPPEGRKSGVYPRARLTSK